MNVFVGTGRVTREPELRQTTNGKSVCTLRVAIDQRRKRNGETVTDFYNVVTWGTLAELVYSYLSKGRTIGITGSLATREWTTRDGQKRIETEIIADEVDFIGKRNDDADTSNGARTHNADADLIATYDEDVPF